MKQIIVSERLRVRRELENKKIQGFKQVSTEVSIEGVTKRTSKLALFHGSVFKIRGPGPLSARTIDSVVGVLL